MNFGSSIKKVAANINSSLKFYKVTGGCKPRCAGIVFDTLKYRNEPILKDQLKSLSLCPILNGNPFFSFPKTDVAIKKSIIEPDEGLKIRVELPLSDSRDKAFELPFHTEKEVNEPKGQVIIIKKAVHMLVIRRKKMKKHKKKKHLKRFKVQIETREIRRKNREENELQKQMQTLYENSVTFSAEDYVSSRLEIYNWVKPVTAVRGRLAPDWVIKEHLKKEKERKLFKERCEECISLQK